MAKRFIEDGYRHLALGGKLIMVTNRLDWYRNKLIHIFGWVKVTEKDGYYVFMAEKRSRKRLLTAVKKAKAVQKTAKKICCQA